MLISHSSIEPNKPKILLGFNLISVPFMKSLDKKYQATLNKIKTDIQASEILATYLEEENEELYKTLQDTYEPALLSLYYEVALNEPLQIIALEKAMLDNDLEGLFIPKILGYCVLRAEVSTQCKYVRQQDHLREIVEAMAHSANFELIRKRCGQTLQIGFALSSDIWITNLCDKIENKRIRQFLQAQKLDKYRDEDERKLGYKKYKLQFKNDLYHTAEFPTNANELKVQFNGLNNFLSVRIERKLNNESLRPYLIAFAKNTSFQNEAEFIPIFGMFINFFSHSAEESKEMAEIFNTLRKSNPNFNLKYFHFINETLNSDMDLNADCDHQVYTMMDKTIKDDITAYFKLIEVVHTKGYIHEDSIETIKSFYSQHEGLSIVNECVRKVIYNYFKKLLNNLEVEDYMSFFDLTKIYQSYQNVFSNEHFTQDVKHLSMDYVNKLLQVYNDKRGKDYQDIKKFVATSFVEFGFLRDKEVVEMFKTRRVKV